jgi:hypothetical protein
MAITGIVCVKSKIGVIDCLKKRLTSMTIASIKDTVIAIIRPDIASINVVFRCLMSRGKSEIKTFITRNGLGSM